MKHRVCACLAAFAFTAIVGPRAASANPDLLEAKRLLEELYVEKAGKKFEEALEQGDSDPTTTAEIHMGRGQVAAALGDKKKALEAYKHALAIDPLLDLPAGTSPKVAQPLQDARALFRGDAKQLALAVNIDTADGVRASASVLSDPFSMVSGIAVEYKDNEGDSNTKSIRSKSDLMQIPLESETISITVSLIDEHGNKLVTNDLLELPSGERVSVGGGEGGEGGGDEEPGEGGGGGSIVTNWMLWGGLAVAAGATGTGFGIWTRSIVSDIDDMTQNSGMHEFSDVLALEEKAKSRALIANISFGVAGACAIAAGVFYFTGDKGNSEERNTAFVPMLGPDQVGITALSRF